MILARSVRPGHTVGVSPGTTTFELGADSADEPSLEDGRCFVGEGPNRRAYQERCLAPPGTDRELELRRARERAAAAAPPALSTVWHPYADEATLKAASLGLVLTPYGAMRPTPYEVTNSGINRQCAMGPHDPQHYTRGEAGYYPDTPLGAIPTDAELAPRIGRQPVMTSEVAFTTPDGPVFWPGPWVPPDGSTTPYPAAAPMSLRGFGDGEVITEDPVARHAAEAVADELAKHQKRLFWLSVASTGAVVVTATIGFTKAWREARHRRSGGS